MPLVHNTFPYNTTNPGVEKYKGLGLFDDPTDPTTWGFGEWGIILLGGYAFLSMMYTSKSAASGVGTIVKKRRSRSKKISSLKKQLKQAKSSWL